MQLPNGYRSLKPEENFFLNDEEEPCGIAVIFKKNFDILTRREIGQIMYLFYPQPDVTQELIKEFEEGFQCKSSFEILLDGNNRKNRRHPERYYDSGYKRPRKGQKINHWI